MALCSLQVLNELVGGFVIIFTAAKLMHQGADEPGGSLIEGVDQVGSAFSAIDVFIHAFEDFFDLFI